MRGGPAFSFLPFHPFSSRSLRITAHLMKKAPLFNEWGRSDAVKGGVCRQLQHGLCLMLRRKKRMSREKRRVSSLISGGIVRLTALPQAPSRHADALYGSAGNVQKEGRRESG
ncbi:MAG: hypothetical protein EGQ81_00535 [Akkermansia sp.]|nr:hypothetical protein [Akkermansia sp.]